MCAGGSACAARRVGEGVLCALVDSGETDNGVAIGRRYRVGEKNADWHPIEIMRNYIVLLTRISILT